MFKITPSLVLFINFFLMLLSWIFYKFPHGDEYLVLFMIPLVFMIAPFVIEKRLIVFLLLTNLAFFTYYRIIGVLDTVDGAVLVLLLVSVTGASCVVKLLHQTIVNYHKTIISGKQHEYNNILNDLELIDQKGRTTENELSRISRLYEITKKLAPSMKFEDLLNDLFGFLEDNFQFQTAHLLVFNKGKFSRGISKSVGTVDYYKDTKQTLDYEGVAEYVQKEDLKPFFAEREGKINFFRVMNLRSDTFMAFPLLIGEQLSAILAVEGATKTSYARFSLLIPQIVLEFRKVELYEQVQELSIIDGLTEVYLRRYLMTRLEEEVDRAERLKLVFSVAMVDVDNFKNCNDKYGHLVGDVILRKIAGKLKESVREIDMIARYGGEEFCIVLPETTRELTAMVAERLRRSIELETIKAFDEEIHMTVSVGIASFPENAKEAEGLMEKADMALYKAKRQGRNRVCVA